MSKNLKKISSTMMLMAFVFMMLISNLPGKVVHAAEEVATPTASIAAGTYIGQQRVTLSCATAGATIYYTMDGSEPTASSAKYTTRLTIASTTTLKAIALKDSNTSNVASFEYKIKAAAPSSLYASGEYKGWPKVALTSDNGATIYYTTDGSTPTTASLVYSAPIATSLTTNIIKAFAVKPGSLETSDISTFTYSINPNITVLTDVASIPKVLKEMSLEEKARLVTGGTSQMGAAGSTAPIPRLNITAMELADGPAGVRLTGRYATAWPNPLMLASTWNTEVIGKIGAATAEEAKYYGVDIMLGPAMNIHRDPLGGRTFEYYSEDPYLTGKVASAYTSALQELGVGATLKHYAANNFENNRMNINEIISERALREIYLPAFEIAVSESKPWAVMSSYPKVNGTHASENLYLNDMLKKTFGFDGLIMSDWGAYKGPQAYATGFDLNTPGRGNYSALIDAVKAGTLAESNLDRAITSILKIVIKTDTFKKQMYDRAEYSSKTALSSELKESGAKLSKEAALEGIVLLKNNNNTLPLTSNAKVGLVGQNAEEKYIAPVGWGSPSKGIIFEGGGSACVNVDPNDVVTLAQGLRDGGLTVVQKNAAGNVIVEGLSEADASYVAANSQIGIISIGEGGTEGSDNTTIALSEKEIDLIKKTADAYHAADKKVIVLLNVAQPTETAAWESYADAIIFVGLPGTYGSEAITDILTGKVSPSGKLVDTWAKSYTDYPTSGNMPSSSQAEIEYKEGIYVGYRYFDKVNLAPMYHFGYGLSYTNFEYSNIKLSKNTFNLSKADEKVTITVDVKNTGKVAGKEVVQLYVHDNYSSIDRPDKELKGFVKTKTLQPEEKQTISLTVNKRDLSYFDEKTAAENDGQWVAEEGTFTLFVGGTSDISVLKTAGKGISAELNAVPTESGQGGTKLPQTGSPVDFTVIVLIGMLAVAAGAGTLYNNRRKTNS